jgi:hydrogenase maturation factor
MSRRNIWLSLPQWEMITNELSYQDYNPFRLYDRELKDWKDTVKRYEDNGYSSTYQYKFERIEIYHLIDLLKTPQTINTILCEYWRDTDFHHVMDYIHQFIGFVINYVDEVDMNTTIEQWEEIRIQMKEQMGNHDKRYWYQNDLIELYKQVNEKTLLVSAL